MPTSYRASLLILAIAGLSACVTETHNGPHFDADKIAQIHRGKSTLADIEALFGPTRAVITQYDGRKIASYTSSNTYSSTGTSLRGNGQPYVYDLDPLIGKLTGTSIPIQLDTPNIPVQILEIDYAPNDVVEDFKLSECRRSKCTPLDVQGH